MSERRREGPDGFDELLRQWMQDDAPTSAPEQILDDLRRSAMTTAQESHRPGWVAMAGLAAAALAVAALVLSIQLTREVGQQEPSRIPSPSAGPTASDAMTTRPARPSSSASPIPSVEPWTRAHVELPAENSSRMLAAAGGPGGYVAVGGGGSVEGLGGALAWHSADGRTWALTLDRNAAPDGSTMRDVVATDDGYVAVGNGPGFRLTPTFPGVPVWLSADGLSWREAASAPFAESDSLYAVARSGEELVAIGFVTENDRQIATAWRSNGDGEAWTRLEMPDAYEASRPIDVATRNDGTTVVITVRDPDFTSPTAWMIRDGVVGEPVRLPLGEAPEPTIRSVVATPDGFTAVGVRSDPDGSSGRLVAWRSADGRAWELFESETLGSGSAAYFDGRGVIVIGTAFTLTESTVAAWELLEDGAWRAMPIDPEGGAADAVVAAPDGRLLVLGHTQEENLDGTAAVWIEP